MRYCYRVSNYHLPLLPIKKLKHLFKGRVLLSFSHFLCNQNGNSQTHFLKLNKKNNLLPDLEMLWLKVLLTFVYFILWYGVHFVSQRKSPSESKPNLETYIQPNPNFLLGGLTQDVLAHIVLLHFSGFMLCHIIFILSKLILCKD